MELLILGNRCSLSASAMSELEKNDISITIKEHLDDAAEAAKSKRFSVALIDLRRAVTNSIILLSRWRRIEPLMPVITITFSDAADDRVASLYAGADDTVSDNTNSLELVARIRTVKQRTLGFGADHLQHGPVTYKLSSGEVTLHGELIHVPRAELGVLRTFLLSKWQVLTVKQIETYLYENSPELRSNTVKVNIHRLRRKLGAGIIETVVDIGYKLGKTDYHQVENPVLNHDN